MAEPKYNGNQDQEDVGPGDDWIDVFEAAKESGYSVHTLRKYAQQGRVPHAQRTKGSPLKFRRSVIRQWALGLQEVGADAA